MNNTETHSRGECSPDMSSGVKSSVTRHTEQLSSEYCSEQSSNSKEDVGFRNFLEEYTIKISEIAAEFWVKGPKEVMYEASASRGRGCGPKKPLKKKASARPKRKACPKPWKSTKRRSVKPKCPKYRAPKRCPKPRGPKRCPKPRAAKLSAKRCPKLKPACPRRMKLCQSEDPSSACLRPMTLFGFEDPTPILEMVDSQDPNV